jgi:hypothetical protein
LIAPAIQLALLKITKKGKSERGREKGKRIPGKSLKHEAILAVFNFLPIADYR